ncbi:MAG TPA: hypothetical protein PLX35_00655 [Cyclobacteriaceae bacterium]|nr:hypothetical protein [Cyclobacteriaceae bacterium]
MLDACANDHSIPATCGDLAWLEKIKQEIVAQGRKGEVYTDGQGTEPLYVVNGCINCADFPIVLYDCRGKARCQTGGISGGNTSQCAWPSETALIWKNY